MTYIKENTPIGAPVAARQAYLERELEKVERELVIYRDTLTALIGYRVIGGINVPYFWDDSAVIADPGSGHIRGNQAVLANVTIFAFHKVDGLGRDLGESLTGLEGQSLVLTNETGNGHWIGSIDAVVDQGAWIEFAVTTLSGGSNPAQEDFFTVQYYPTQDLLGLEVFMLDFLQFAQSARIS